MIAKERYRQKRIADMCVNKHSAEDSTFDSLAIGPEVQEILEAAWKAREQSQRYPQPVAQVLERLTCVYMSVVGYVGSLAGYFPSSVIGPDQSEDGDGKATCRLNDVFCTELTHPGSK